MTHKLRLLYDGYNRIFTIVDHGAHRGLEDGEIYTVVLAANTGVQPPSRDVPDPPTSKDQ